MGVVPPDDTRGAVAVTEPTPVLAMEIVPEPLVTVMPVPAVSLPRVYPDPLPINSWPLPGSVPKPVPPLTTAVIPVPVPVMA